VQVFLIRHAEAAHETVAMRDPHRHLTPVGRRQARAIGDRLRWHDCTPTHIWASPLVRTIQTAELVAASLGAETAAEIPVEAVPALAPDEHPRGVVAALAALPQGAVVVLVGHEPGLSAVGALLVGRPEFASLGKAQAARIDDGELRWRFACDAEAPEIVA
jgi:phosphohistidine phosphatase SixA